MNIEELQRIAVRLSNQSFIRWWVHYNYPCKEPWLMAIAVLDERHCKELENLGFSAIKQGVVTYYTIERTFSLADAPKLTTHDLIQLEQILSFVLVPDEEPVKGLLIESCTNQRCVEIHKKIIKILEGKHREQNRISGAS